MQHGVDQPAWVPVALFPWLRALFVFTGAFRGVCKKIDHFPEDADYEQDTAEYLLRKFPLPLQSARVGGGARRGSPAITHLPVSVSLLIS